MSLSEQQVQDGAARREYDRARRALIESEQKYRRVVDMATEGMCEIDENGRFGQVSARFAQILGYAPEEMAGRPLVDFLLPEDFEDYGRRDRELKGGLAQRFERRFVAKDGSIRWVSVSTAPIVAADGTFSASLSMMMDITERKNMEKALQLTQFSVDHAADSIFWTDADGKLLYVSYSLCASVGRSRSELLGSNLFDLDPTLTAEQWSANWARLKREGSFTIETVHRKAGGELFPVEAYLNYVAYSDREYNCVFARDVSSRRRAEEDLRRAEEQLVQAQKMEAVGRLAGGIAHDFNNLLMPIIGNASLLLAEMPADHPDAELLRDIKEAGEKAAALTKQMLAFSRGQKLEPRIVQLNDIIIAVEPLLKGALGKDVDVTFHLDPDLTEIEADRHQVEQVLVNLAVNARDAMPSGGTLVVETANVVLEEAHCSVNAELKPGPYAMLAVCDSGCGMDGGTVERAFEPFFTTKDVGKGTGLGLSTVFGIVRQTGGGISVHSEPSRGTCFRIYLPAEPRAAAKATLARGPAAD